MRPYKGLVSQLQANSQNLPRPTKDHNRKSRKVSRRGAGSRSRSTFSRSPNRHRQEQARGGSPRSIITPPGPQAPSPPVSNPPAPTPPIGKATIQNVIKPLEKPQTQATTEGPISKQQRRGDRSRSRSPSSRKRHRSGQPIQQPLITNTPGRDITRRIIRKQRVVRPGGFTSGRVNALAKRSPIQPPNPTPTPSLPGVKQHPTQPPQSQQVVKNLNPFTPGSPEIPPQKPISVQTPNPIQQAQTGNIHHTANHSTRGAIGHSDQPNLEQSKEILQPPIQLPIEAESALKEPMVQPTISQTENSQAPQPPIQPLIKTKKLMGQSTIGQTQNLQTPQPPVQLPIKAELAQKELIVQPAINQTQNPQVPQPPTQTITQKPRLDQARDTRGSILNILPQNEESVRNILYKQSKRGRSRKPHSKSPTSRSPISRNRRKRQSPIRPPIAPEAERPRASPSRQPPADPPHPTKTYQIQNTNPLATEHHTNNTQK